MILPDRAEVVLGVAESIEGLPAPGVLGIAGDDGRGRDGLAKDFFGDMEGCCGVEGVIDMVGDCCDSAIDFVDDPEFRSLARFKGKKTPE